MSRSRSAGSTAVSAAVLAMVLAACGGRAEGAAGTPAGPEQRVTGGTVVYAHQQEPPCVFGGWIEQAYLSQQVLDALTSLDDKGVAQPWLAQKWSVSPDNLTWTFTLKPGVTFTDGTPLDADAVAYNIDYWTKGGNSTASVWLGGYYSKATAVDARTVQIQLSRPYPRLPETVSQGYFGIQSKKALQTRSKEDNCTDPIGSGAFVIQKWTRGQDIVLLRNDHWTSWPAVATHQGPATIEKLDWKFVPDPTTRVAALRAGEVAAIYDVPAVEWKPLAAQGFAEQNYVTRGRPVQLSFNTRLGPFTDERVRQAFAWSLDRKAIVTTIGQGHVPYEGNGPVSRSTVGYSQKAADSYHLDPAKANALLDAAGWTGRDGDGYRTKGGQTLQVVLPYGAGSIVNTDGASILQGVQQQAKATGFKVKLIPVSLSELFAGKYSTPPERDIQVGYWTAVTAGILYVNWRPGTDGKPSPWNDAYYDSPELWKTILAGNSALSLDEQNGYYRQAQDFIAEHALSIGLYDRLSSLAIGPKLKGVRQEQAQGGPIFSDAYLVK